MSTTNAITEKENKFMLSNKEQKENVLKEPRAQNANWETNKYTGYKQNVRRHLKNKRIRWWCPYRKAACCYSSTLSYKRQVLPCVPLNATPMESLNILIPRDYIIILVPNCSCLLCTSKIKLISYMWPVRERKISMNVWHGTMQWCLN